MDKKIITVAVIGCGRISRIHFPELNKIENVKVKYACDLIIEKAEKSKELCPKIENVITDYKIALADKEVDAVYVLTPNYAHYTITMDALKAGKHVFCEKPITVNYELSVEMAKEAEKQGKILNIGVCNRYHKSVEKIAEMVKEGKLGNIYHIYCSFRSFRSIPGLGGAFTTKALSGGGVLIDWGVHFFDIIMYVLGQDTKLSTVSCDAYNELAKDMKKYKYKNMWAEDTSDKENGTNDVDDMITGYIRTNKASISFNGAWAQNIDDKNALFIEFMGDKGGVRLNYGDKFKFYDGDTLETIEEDYEIPNMFLLEDIAFVNSILTGEKCKTNIDYVLETAKLLDVLYKSAEERKEIKL